jgi:hypothetical protein
MAGWRDGGMAQSYSPDTQLARGYERLTKFDDTCAGWHRYMTARIDVYDMATRHPFIQDGQYA